MCMMMWGLVKGRDQRLADARKGLTGHWIIVIKGIEVEIQENWVYKLVQNDPAVVPPWKDLLSYPDPDYQGNWSKFIAWQKCGLEIIAYNMGRTSHWGGG